MPTEVFSDWTQTDPNSRITATASKMSWAGLAKNETAYSYFDYGANHFDGDFEFLLEIYFDDATNGGYTGCLVMSNSLGDLNTIAAAHTEILALWRYDAYAPNNYILRCMEMYSGSGYIDFYNPTLDTLYYCKFKRDESVGTYGTIYLYIYDDADRTNLLDTLSVALHGEKADYRYMMCPCSTNDGGTSTTTGYIENLDLQESPGPTPAPSVGTKKIGLPTRHRLHRTDFFRSLALK